MAHSDTTSRRLMNRLRRVVKRHTDDPAAPDPTARRMDAAPPDLGTAFHPNAGGPETWSQIGAVRVPKGHNHPDPVQLPDSRAEEGGPPVYADPDMVSPAAAERMRPLFRDPRDRPHPTS